MRRNGENMRNKLKQYLGMFLLLFFAGCILNSVPCLAASATVDLTSDSTEVTVGDTVKIYIKIDSATTFTDFEANLVYDETILEYQGGASVISGGNGFLRISDRDVAAGSTSRKYALEFTALKAGDCALSFSDQVMVYDESGNEMSVSNNELKITAKAQQSASTNASLKSLNTSPIGITPVFDKNTFEYNVNVSNDTEKLIITAIPEDEKAIVSIIGNDSLKEGENKVIVSVIAESGDIIEYTVDVFREPSPTAVVQPTTTPSIEGNSWDILQDNGETYFVYSGKYKLVEPGSEVVIPDGYTKTELTISGVTIIAYVPSDNTESELVLIYAMNSSGEEGFYQYDKLENTLQRYVAAEASNDSAQSENYRSKLNTAAVVIAILSALSLFLLVTVILLFLRNKNNRKDDFE
jgi:hypothetical protein